MNAISTKLFYGNSGGKFRGRAGMQGAPWHIEGLKKYGNKKTSCRDCKYYCKDDKSCFKGVDIKDAGYFTWDKCRCFILEAFADDSKKQEVLKKRGKKHIEKPLEILNSNNRAPELRKLNVEIVYRNHHPYYKIYLDETRSFLIEKTAGMTEEEAIDIFKNEVVPKRE